MKTVAHHYGTFAQAVVGAGAPAGQRTAMKMAFYGGAAAMLGLMLEASAASETDDIGVTRIEQLRAELREFTASMRKQRR